MIRKSEIAGAELWYERGSIPKLIEFSFDLKFFQAFEECFLEIEELYKNPTRIILAGTYVEKPGAHKLGRAADLDGIEFEDGEGVWMATKHGRLTAAIQGVFMKHLGVVLGWTYDEAHSDHLHIDDTREWGFRHNSRSIVTYIQWVLGFEGHVLKVDGIWGAKMEEAYFIYTGVEGYPTNTEYKDFLSSISWKFFSQMKRESEPSLPTLSRKRPP